MNHLRFATCALLGVLTTDTAAAQTVQTTSVPDAPSCARCTVSIRTIATLGTKDPPGAINSTFGVTVDGRGRYWVTQEEEVPFVYDASGKFIAAIGAKGGGPGEFQYPGSPTPIAGDSVLIVDNGRITVVGPDLRPGRVIRVARQPGRMVFAQWPSLAISTRPSWGRDVNFPSLLRVSLTRSGIEELSAFGPERGEMDPRLPLQQVLAPELRHGRLWTADGAAAGRYRLHQWNTDGVLTRSLERKPDWFTKVEPPGPLPAVSEIAEDANGFVWVFVSVRAPTWREAMPKLGPGANEVLARLIAWEKYYKTTIEVLDPRTARVVARQELNEWVMRALPGGRAVIYFVDSDGTPHGKIVELSIVGRQ